MLSVAAEVREYVQNRPFLEEALARKIINYKNLASEIIGYLNSEKQFDLDSEKDASVMMALRRYGKELEGKFKELHASLGTSPSNPQLELHSTIYGLVQYTLARSVGINEKIAELYNHINFQEGGWLTVTHGLSEITLIIRKENTRQLLDIFKDYTIKQKNPDLSSISLKIPETAINTPGLLYSVTKALYFDGINVVEIVSTYTEMTFILKELDIPQAMQVLRSLVM